MRLNLFKKLYSLSYVFWALGFISFAVAVQVNIYFMATLIFDFIISTDETQAEHDLADANK